MPRPRSGFDAQAPPLSYTPFSGSGSRPTNHRDQVARLCTSVAALTSDTAGPRERPRGQSSRAVASLSTLPPFFRFYIAATRPSLREWHPIPFAPRFPHLGLLTPARIGSHAPRRAQSPAIRTDADGSPAPRPSPDGRYIARPLTDPSVRRRSDAPRGCCGRRVGAREDSSLCAVGLWVQGLPDALDPSQPAGVSVSVSVSIGFCGPSSPASEAGYRARSPAPRPLRSEFSSARL